MIYINEETLDGKNTTHATTVVVYQRKVFGPMPPPPEALADHTQRKRSLGNTADHNEILECSAYGRRPTVTTFLGQMGNEPFMSTTPEYRLSCNMDVTWALSRIPSSKLFETDQAREEADPVVPNWSAFNSLVFMKTSLPSVIGYCPMINGASTELSTVYTVLKKAQRMCAHLNQRDMVITFDLAIYSKAKQIQFKFPEEFKDTIVRMGGFHIALNFIAVIGKRYQNSGLEDILIESGAYGPNSVTSLMKGKSYNRGVRAHKLMMEALFRLRWQAFVRWLNKTTQESLRSSLDEQHVIKRMETFQMAINNKENVSQNLESMVTELKPLMEQFEAFRQEQKSKSKMFAFWDEYICMVIILLQFIKAERSADWSLHLAATTAMVPYFYAHDRPNYSRWLPVYLADMAQLEQKHPEVYRQFMEGEHAVSRSSQPFAKVWTDMALEQSINLDSKSKGGIVGISQNPAALQRWFITSHERAAITTAVKKMCALNDSDRVGTHKEAGHNRAQRDEKDVRGIVSCFTEGQMKDPFLEDNDSLSNITTGVVLPPEVAEKLVKSAEQGLVQMKGFIQARLNANTISFWEPIPSLKVKTFNITAKKASVKTSREKLVAIAEDRDLFGRLLIVARVRQIDLREILSYELSAVPYSLAHSDGTLRKTTKSVLLHNLEGDVTVEPSLSPSTTLPTAHIVDGMALIHTIKFAGASTFGELAAKYYEIITSYYRQGNCSRIDLVFDQYWDLSIKAGERQRRGEVTTLEVQIHGLSTPVPKQWLKYISNVKNKVRLCAFLTSTLVEIGQRQLQQNKELVIGGGNGDQAFSVKYNCCEVIQELNADHEEADTRMMLHAKHAALESERIVVQSPDTDVLLLCVSHYDGIGCSELWFRTGTRDRLRYIPAHMIANKLGPSMCKALPAFHALTGCDSTSSLAGIGKTKSWKTITKSTTHQDSLGNVGQSPDVDDELTRRVEAFVCCLYSVSTRNPATTDEARYLLFCQKSRSNMLLPPTCDSLQQHIKRSNYQAYVWRNALTARQNLPSPDGHGWKLENDMLHPILMTKSAAPESILELTSCGCLKSSCTRNCSCSSNGLACTESCKCMAEENCHNPNKGTTTSQLDDSTDSDLED